MCGIFGFVGKPKKNVNRLMKEMAFETERRGTDAAGYLRVDSEEISYKKAPIRAREFYKDKELDLSDTHIFIGHNRLASHGDRKAAKNAHPFVTQRWALVHNGTCLEALDLKKELNLKTVGTTDSEAMLAVIEHDGKVDPVRLETFSGYSIVVLDLEEEVLYFARDRFPMVICDLRGELGIRIFCSDVNIVKDAMAKTFGRKHWRKYVGWDGDKVFDTKSFNVYTIDANGDLEFNRIADYNPPPEPERAQVMINYVNSDGKVIRRRAGYSDEVVTPHANKDWSRKMELWRNARERENGVMVTYGD